MLEVSPATGTRRNMHTCRNPPHCGLDSFESKKMTCGINRGWKIPKCKCSRGDIHDGFSIKPCSITGMDLMDLKSHKPQALIFHASRGPAVTAVRPIRLARDPLMLSLFWEPPNAEAPMAGQKYGQGTS